MYQEKRPIGECMPPIGTIKNTYINAHRITNQIDPLDFYIHELGKLLIGRSGWIEAGPCPFHVGDSPDSFQVDLNFGAFRCLSCEAEGCDIVEFTMAFYDLSHAETVQKLTYKWSINPQLNLSQTSEKEHRHGTH